MLYWTRDAFLARWNEEKNTLNPPGGDDDGVRQTYVEEELLLGHPRGGGHGCARLTRPLARWLISP